MEYALMASKILFYLLSGLGVFFIGIGVLWFVSMSKGGKEDNQ